MTTYEIEKVLQKFVTRCKYGISSSDISLASQEIAAKTDEATKEWSEFTEWLMTDEHDYIYVNGKFIDQFTNVEFTPDELFEYWKQNIQEK